MSRFSHYDTDEERLPSGMTRIGYDADTETYTYRDSDGSTWEGAPGNQYGRLTRVSASHDDQGGEESPFIEGDYARRRGGGRGGSDLQEWAIDKQSWRQAWAPLLNFLVLVFLFLLGVIWLLYHTRSTPAEIDCALGEEQYTINKGDTCWGIAQEKGLSVEKLIGANDGLNCDKLKVGGLICVPMSGGDDDAEQAS